MTKSPKITTQKSDDKTSNSELPILDSLPTPTSANAEAPITSNVGSISEWLYFGSDFLGCADISWFESREELLKNVGVRELEAIGASSAAWEKLAEIVQPFLDDPARVLNRKSRTKLNRFIRDVSNGEFRIDWWGSFLDLATGNGRFESAFREAFYEYLEIDDVVDRRAPISSAEMMMEFLAYAKEWVIG